MGKIWWRLFSLLRGESVSTNAKQKAKVPVGERLQTCTMALFLTMRIFTCMCERVELHYRDEMRSFFLPVFSNKYKHMSTLAYQNLPKNNSWDIKKKQIYKDSILVKNKQQGKEKALIWKLAGGRCMGRGWRAEDGSRCDSREEDCERAPWKFASKPVTR